MNKIKKSIKKIVAIIISTTVLLSTFVTSYGADVKYGSEIINAPTKTYEEKFPDVKKDYWAFNFIGEMIERKVLNGYPDGFFRPDNIVSRAEFSKIMVTAAGINLINGYYTELVNYEDMRNHWSNTYVNAASDYLTGYVYDDGKRYFKPDSPALREDIAVAVVKLKGYDVKLADLSIIQKMFKDYESISESLKPYIAVAVEKGLMSGYPDSTFRAQDSITRAEAATILRRSFQYGDNNKVVTDTTTTPDTTVQPTTKPTVNPTVTPASTEEPEPTLQPTVKPTPISKKYSIELLAGGNGKGLKDGKGEDASITDISSMIIDGDDNVLFVDNKTKIRKFDGSKLKTIYDSTEDFYMESASKRDTYKFEDIFLAYDKEKGKTYVLGNQNISIYDNSFTALYDISSTVSLSVYEKGNFYNIEDSTIGFLNDGSMLFYGYYGVFIEQGCYQNGIIKAKPNLIIDKYIKHGYEIASFNRSDIKNNSRYLLVKNNDIFVLDTSSKLYKYNFSTNKFTQVETDNDYSLKSNKYLTTYNGKFYFTKGTSVYEMDTEGNSKLFIDVNEIDVKDNLPLTEMRNLVFDSNGNLVFFDTDNYALRIIRKN